MNAKRLINDVVHQGGHFSYQRRADRSVVVSGRVQRLRRSGRWTARRRLHRQRGRRRRASTAGATVARRRHVESAAARTGGLHLHRLGAVARNFDGASLVEVLLAAVTLEALSHQTEQHFAAVVAERGRLVAVHDQRMHTHRRNVLVMVGIRDGYTCG